EGVGPWRIEDVPDPARVLARVAGADRLELRGDAVARADLHLTVADARLEVVEGTHRRAADHLALEVIDPAVAGADEVARGGHEVHRAAEVRATGRERDVWLVRLGLVEGRPGDRLADIGGGLAGLADPLDEGEYDRCVGLLREPADGPHAFPALLRPVEDRRHREPNRGEDDHRARDPTDRLAGNRERLPAGHRLALEVAGRMRLRQTAVASGTVALVGPFRHLQA